MTKRRNLTETETALLECALRLARDDYKRFAAEEMRKLFEDYPRVSVEPIADDEDEDDEPYRRPSSDRERFGSDHGL